MEKKESYTALAKIFIKYFLNKEGVLSLNFSFKIKINDFGLLNNYNNEKEIINDKINFKIVYLLSTIFLNHNKIKELKCI